eukprot:symbB.v1.2.012516.t1/scaffold867.1/size156651/2
MALQFALRRREIGALQVALAEATAARVADEMMAEASSLLQAGEDGHCWAMGILRSFIEGKHNFLCIKQVKAGV